ncbi:N-acetyl sugar amidotransferase [Chitinophaga lutea]
MSTPSNTEYRICSRCVMDTSDPEITFDSQGHCNHCTGSIARLEAMRRNHTPEALERIIAEIKEAGKNNEYDCIIGISGGVDSSYLAWLVKREFGLRPLAIHLDNGWNSELAVKNIENIVKKLDIDLFTWVINWEVFRELQLAFLSSSVIDLEMLSDNAIVASIYKLAKEKNIKYFLDGVNIETESIMPETWYNSLKVDSLNIRSIYKKHGSKVPLKTYPLLSFFDFYRFLKGDLKQYSLLNYIDYNKVKAKELIQRELDWKDYGGKHFESRITQFYQAYILPQKYGVDKRRAHLSSLICSGQISRDEALAELERPLYTPSKMEEDKAFFIKKLGLTPARFEEIMNTPATPHDAYPSYKARMHRLIRIKNKLFKSSK